MAVFPKPVTAYDLDDEKDHTSFNPETYSGHPLMEYVNIIIGRSTNCDMFWTCMAARFLKADYDVAYEMLRAIRADNARNDAIRGAARAALNDADYELYVAVRNASVHLTRQRDIFAHQCIGLNPKLPNALLVIDSKVIGRIVFFNPDGYTERSEQRIGREIPKEHRKDIYVYEITDLEDLALMATITEYMVVSLFQALGPPGAANDGARHWLFEHRQSPLYVQSPTQKTKPKVRPEWPQPVHGHELEGTPRPPPPYLMHLRV